MGSKVVLSTKLVLVMKMMLKSKASMQSPKVSARAHSFNNKSLFYALQSFASITSLYVIYITIHNTEVSRRSFF